jgi:ketosteroid isomerase-like protein
MKGDNKMRAVVEQFIAAINAHDVSRLLDLMTADHQFIDAAGNQVTGLETLERAWQGYIAWMPDYTITINEWFEQGDQVALFGEAQATYAVQGQLLRENQWTLPAAWKATVRENKIAIWQVYCDTKPVFDIMARNPS